ncbi:MAG: serine/threonine protein kinase [Betaproteobacteria bacterium]
MSTVPADPWHRRLSRLGQQRPVEIVLALVALTAAALWVYGGVQRALEQLAAQNLRTLVAGEATVIDVWVGEKRLNVQRWAADPRVTEATRQLLAAAERGESDAVAACAGEPGRRWLALIDQLRQAETASAAHLIDPQGRVLAARSVAKCGRSLSAAQRAPFEPVLAGAVRFHASQTSVDRIGVTDADGKPKVWIAAPVTDDGGRVIAVMDIGKPAAGRFSELFEAMRSGDTGEVYAFDLSGRMLSESRFRAELEESRSLRPGESAILALRLTDGEDAAGDRLSQLIRQALTAISAPAQPGVIRQGELLAPYVNYRGESVVGAWRWLDDMGFGVAVEVAEREAFAPMARLNTVFAVLGVALGLVAFSLAVTLLRVQRMARQVEAARHVGNYEMFEEIGQGGVARVYRAHHRLLKRPTAVKVIQLHKSTDELLARFDREVRLCSQLMHPNTIEIFDYGRTPEGLPFYAMELLDGATVLQLVERGGPFGAARTVHVLRGVAGSLAEAHDRGLVHRDVTPANIMLCRKGGQYDVPKLLDFGLIKDTRGEHTRDLTQALRVLGTPSYMAPERIVQPGSADFRSDLYAIGAVGYFLLTGRPPLEGDTDLSLAYHVVNTAPTPLLEIASHPVPAALARLIGDCLSKQADARPQTAAAIGEALDLLAREHPWTQAEARAAWQVAGATAGA